MLLKSLITTISIIYCSYSFCQTFEVKANSERTMKDSIIITDTFVLRQGATLFLNQNFSSCSINCNVVILEKGAKIIGKGIDGADGKDGVSNSSNGANGQNGSNGINLKIQTSVFTYCDIVFDLSGGKGGVGGKGVNGRKGRNASCCTYGAGGGGNGGSGGIGGNGGNAGSVRIKYSKINSTCGNELGSSNFNLSGGKGNIGGAFGIGGAGGNRASGCFPGCNKPRGRNGRNGIVGTNGINGKPGTILTE